MCVLGLGAIMGAGAGAGAAGAASALTNIGTAVAIGGNLVAGIQGMRAGKAQAAALTEQAAAERRNGAVQAERERRQFMSQIADQRAQLAARGVQLDSVTAIALGQSAASEMSFQTQATRSAADARATELSAAARAARAGGQSAMLRGTFGAASSFLTAAPEIWPSLKGVR